MFFKVAYFAVYLSLIYLEFQIANGSHIENEIFRNENSECFAFWASSTTIRILSIQGRRIVKDRSHDVGQAITSIVYNPVQKLLYFADQHTGSFTVTDFGDLFPTEIEKNSFAMPDKMRYDWNTGNVYMKTGNEVSVLKLFHPVTVYSRTKLRKHFDVMYDFVVHPRHGLMFWTDLYEKGIQKSWLDGTNTESIFTGFGEIALDHSQDVLYVTRNGSILALDLNGKILRTINPKLPDRYTKKSYPFDHLEVCGRNLIFVSGYELLHLDLITENTEVLSRSEESTRDLKAYSSSSIRVVETPCTDSSTKCGKYQICLHSPKGVTQCHFHKSYL